MPCPLQAAAVVEPSHRPTATTTGGANLIHDFTKVINPTILTQIIISNYKNDEYSDYDSSSNSKKEMNNYKKKYVKENNKMIF